MRRVPSISGYEGPVAGVDLQDSSNGQFSNDLSRSDSRCIKMIIQYYK